jgi:hypothetical protein
LDIEGNWWRRWDCMTNSGFHIHGLLKTHHRNVRWEEKKGDGSGDRTDEAEKLEISVEGRKKQICKKAANKVIERLTRTGSIAVPFSEESH